MKQILNKELLGAVLGLKDITNIKIYNTNIVSIEIQKETVLEINIYELVYKCKEWVYKNKYVVSSGLSKAFDGTVEYDCIIEHFDTYYSKEDVDGYKQFIADSEEKAVFKACKWVLENKDK